MIAFKIEPSTKNPKRFTTAPSNAEKTLFRLNQKLLSQLSKSTKTKHMKSLATNL